MQKSSQNSGVPRDTFCDTDRVDPTPDQAADAVERNDCPKCEASAGSACRTRGGKNATKYHTPRFVLIAALREELEVLFPAARSPGRPWKQGPAPAAVQVRS